MSTSLLYHGFGIVGYRYIRSEYRGGDVIFTVAKKKFNLRCPVCKSKRIIKHGALPRWFHSLPIGNKPTYIKTEIARVECKDCKTNRQSDIGFADPRLTYTKALGRYVLDLAKHMTIVDVSRHLALSWDIIKSIQKRYLQKKYAKPDLKRLKQIAIDEIYVGKNRFLTVVLDVASGAVVFVGNGKGSEALEPFWQRVRRSRNIKIEAVAIDMSPAYIKAVRDNLKKAVIVFDHFHVVKLLNEKISDFRRQLYNNTSDVSKRTLLKGTRWLLLTARENLEDKQERAQRLNLALEINKPLATVYYMKEDLRQLWYWTGDKKAAEWHLRSWIDMARISGIDMLKKFAATLEDHFDGILAYFDTDMVNTVNIKQVSLASFFAGLPGACKRLVNIFQFMVRGGVIVKRRLISLICAGWVPYELASSWSYLYLIAGVSAVMPIPIVSSRVLLTVTAPLAMNWKGY